MGMMGFRGCVGGRSARHGGLRFFPALPFSMGMVFMSMRMAIPF